MKAYGHSRTDKLECEYGCCNGKSGKQKNCRGAVDKANRKTARQDAAAIVNDSLKDSPYLDESNK
jgi:hypothetical protein